MKELFPEIPRIQGRSIELRQVTDADAAALQRFAQDREVYRYLPTFLFEQKYEDVHYCISRMYDECLEESLILGIYKDGQFAGLAEFYGYNASIHKISVGYRLARGYWGQGIATEALGLMTDYLLTNTDIEIITASTMVENQASAAVLRNNGFDLVVSSVGEDWGYPEPTIADKWIR